MRHFVDTEFIERGYEKIELISVGIVAEDVSSEQMMVAAMNAAGESR